MSYIDRSDYPQTFWSEVGYLGKNHCANCTAMFMATKARWNTEGDSSASRSPWLDAGMTSKPGTVKRNLDEWLRWGLLVEAGLDGDVGSLPNTPVSLLALALKALDDVALSVFRDRYAKSSTVFCGTGGRSWIHVPSGDPGLEREWSEVSD
ncbi:hypothetical protein BASA81_015122 [Batrachochytrium salamandrivorans]|nr:hypothetical protein BASA81_015122 [Batrachochytrium salamandrivorans]